MHADADDGAPDAADPEPAPRRLHDCSFKNCPRL
jgi:hypothetical protein